MVQKYLIASLNDQVEKYFNYASQKSSFISFNFRTIELKFSVMSNGLKIKDKS